MGGAHIVPKDSGTDTNLFTRRIDYDRMRLCRSCGKVYGFWSYRPEMIPSIPEYCKPERLYYQKCHPRCPEFNEKQDMPDEDWDQKKWPAHDFNTQVELCHCCGAELVHSGTRWSVWFCSRCLPNVIAFNTTYQAPIIPIGRHSLMAGYTLRAQDAHDDAKLTQFVGNAHSLFDRIHLLSRWAADRVRTNLERTSIAGDIGLPAYLALVEEQHGKEGALKGLVRYMQEAIL